MRFLLLSLVLTTSMAVAQPLPEATRALRAGDSDAALEALMQTPRDSAELPLAVLESARIHYKQGRWSEFFGLAAYGRLAWPNTVIAEKLRILESMALLRHCRVEKASGVLSIPAPASFDKAPKAPPFMKARKLMTDWLQIAKEATFNDPSKDPKKKPEGVFQHENYWPVKLEAGGVSKLDPFKFRLPLPPLCEEPEATK